MYNFVGLVEAGSMQLTLLEFYNYTKKIPEMLVVVKLYHRPNGAIYNILYGNWFQTLHSSNQFQNLAISRMYIISSKNLMIQYT